MHSNNSSELLQSNLTIENLDIYQCCFMDFPEAGIDCSYIHPQICLKCEIRGSYFSGESIDDYYSYGHVISRILCIVCFVFGIIGILSNFAIMIILQRMQSKKSYDLLLTFLAFADILCCLASISDATSIISFYGNLICKHYKLFEFLNGHDEMFILCLDNWFGRNVATLFWGYVSAQAVMLCKISNP